MPVRVPCSCLAYHWAVMMVNAGVIPASRNPRKLETSSRFECAFYGDLRADSQSHHKQGFKIGCIRHAAQDATPDKYGEGGELGQRQSRQQVADGELSDKVSKI